MNAHPHSPPRWYWIVAGLGLLWVLVGVASLVMDLTMSDAALAQMSDERRQLYTDRPDWLVAVYVTAVISGLAGAVALLMRRQWAVHALALSLAAVVVQFGYTFAVLDPIGRLGAAEAVPLPAAILVIGVAMLLFARAAASRGWLGATHGIPVRA